MLNCCLPRFVLFFSKIIFYWGIFQIRGIVLKRIILTPILLLLSLLAHG